MRFRYRRLHVVLFFLLLIVGGCASKQQTIDVPAASQWPVTMDNSLINKISVIGFVSGRTSGNLLRLQFTLKNILLYASVDALYQVRCFDNTGFRVENISETFVRIHLPAGETKVYDTVIPSQKAERCEVIITGYKNTSGQKEVTNETAEPF